MKAPAWIDIELLLRWESITGTRAAMSSGTPGARPPNDASAHGSDLDHRGHGEDTELDLEWDRGEECRENDCNSLCGSLVLCGPQATRMQTILVLNSSLIYTSALKLHQELPPCPVPAILCRRSPPS